MVNCMVSLKGLYDGGNAFPDKVFLLVYPFFCLLDAMPVSPTFRVMDKITVMAAPRHPASASRSRNKLRARSPLFFASLLSEWLKLCEG